jgi:ATP-dependent Zn protease
MNLTRGIDLAKIALQMGGASGAEVKGVCTEAGMYALRERRVHVGQEDFEMAVAKVFVLMLGSQEGLGTEHVHQETFQINCVKLIFWYSSVVCKQSQVSSQYFIE